MNVLVIGAGAIGIELIKECESMDQVEICYVLDNHPEKARRSCERFGKAKVINEFDEAFPEVDLVVEAASQAAVGEYGPRSLKKAVDLMIMSIGALVDDKLREDIFQLAEDNDVNIYIPSGAICGIDGITSAAITDIDEISLETRKPPAALKNSEYVIKRGIDLDSLKKETVLYDGPASEAVKKFPKNVNVAATLSLSGIGFQRTNVKIICDPSAKSNTHTIRLKGKAGELKCVSDNAPSPDNPGTSYLAALSAVSTLRKICGNVWIGL